MIYLSLMLIMALPAYAAQPLTPVSLPSTHAARTAASAAGQGSQTCKTPGLWDSMWGTAVINADGATGSFYYHYQVNTGDWVYYSAAPLTVTSSASGFKVSVSYFGHIRATSVFDVQWQGSDCLMATGTYAFNNETPKTGEWFRRSYASILSVAPSLGTVDIVVCGPPGPTGIDTGTVTIKMIGASSNIYAYTTTEAYTPRPQYTAGADNCERASLSIVRPNIKRDKYSSMTAVWNIPGAFGPRAYTPAQPWNVKGVVLYTGYNTPNEADASCQGTTVNAWVVDSMDSCKFTKYDLTQIFMTQVHQNGSGRTNSYGLIKSGQAAVTNLGSKCKNKFPAGANVDNSFLMVSTIEGSCQTTLVGDVSTAVNPGPGRSGSEYQCGNTIILVNSANADYQNRTADDRCGKCGEDPTGHYDAYKRSESCSAGAVGNLGDYWTIKP